MDPQIERTYGNADWAVRTYASRIADAQHWGDEFGLHTHAWRWDAAIGQWVADHDNRAWIERCLEVSFAAYKRAFGRNCEIFRFGDGWLDEATLGLLERLGVRID
jgi:peptidoglycan/xylan/chitin deacetylase (PgdA/CDA1 family)